MNDLLEYTKTPEWFTLLSDLMEREEDVQRVLDELFGEGEHSASSVLSFMQKGIDRVTSEQFTIEF